MADSITQYMSNLSINSDGWIILLSLENPNNNDHIAIIPSCQRLLDELQLDLSCDTIQETNANTSLEELPYKPKLSQFIMKAIADIRRMGTPKDGEKKQRGKKKKNGSSANAVRLEKQRRLRNEKEQEEKNRLLSQGESNDFTDADEEKGDVFVDDANDGDATADELPMELRLAATLNSIRVVVPIIRMMLHHSKCKDHELKMKHGPSIKKDGKRFYFFSQNVYSDPTKGQWKEIKREFTAMLDDLPVVNGKSAKDDKEDKFVDALFQSEIGYSSMSQEDVAKKCIILPDLNTEVSAEIHKTLMNRFESDHDKKAYTLQRAIENLKYHLLQAISRRFKDARLTVYGSCLSGLALEGSHDVDISIYIPELHKLRSRFDNHDISGDNYHQAARKIIFRVRDALLYYRGVGFFDLVAITRARVPLIKGTSLMNNPHTPDGHLSFDLCFLNDIAVVNSNLLREYSLFDSRVRILMLSVKSFAKYNSISSAADGTLSSYSWMNLVIFYLQCIGLLPNLQCPTLIEEHDLEIDLNDRWNSILGLKTYNLTKDKVSEKGIWQQSPALQDSNMAALLYGFFNFYTNIFPKTTSAASIRLGKISLQKTSLSSKLGKISIEDPYEICDSHCPHDLGCHVDEGGQAQKIDKMLRQATKELGIFLQWGQQPSPGEPTVPSVGGKSCLFGLLGPSPNHNKSSSDTNNKKIGKGQNAHPQRSQKKRGSKGNHQAHTQWKNGQTQPTSNNRGNSNNHKLPPRMQTQAKTTVNPAKDPKFMAQQKVRHQQIMDEKKKKKHNQQAKRNNKPKSSAIKKCYKCGKEGHVKKECPGAHV